MHLARELRDEVRKLVINPITKGIKAIFPVIDGQIRAEVYRSNHPEPIPYGIGPEPIFAELFDLLPRLTLSEQWAQITIVVSCIDGDVKAAIGKTDFYRWDLKNK